MKKNHLFITLAVLIIVGVVGRLMFHQPNVTPITALALFISAYIGVRYSLPVIFIVMCVSDAVIGFYSWPVMLAVYGSFGIAGLLGYCVQKKKSVVSVTITTVTASLIFFLVTNWAVWQFGTMYSPSFSGLMQSYIMAIPFFKNALLGDLFYTGAFFGIYEAARYRLSQADTVYAFLRLHKK